MNLPARLRRRTARPARRPLVAAHYQDQSLYAHVRIPFTGRTAAVRVETPYGHMARQAGQDRVWGYEPRVKAGREVPDRPARRAGRSR